MFKQIFFTAVLCFFVLAVPFVAGAQFDEINYGSIATDRGEQVVLKYTNPAGDFFYTCSLVDFSCGTRQNEASSLLPSINDATSYTSSPDGSLALVTTDVSFASTSIHFHAIYDIAGDSPAFVRLLPYNEAAVVSKITDNNQYAVFIHDEADEPVVTRVDIDSGDMVEIDPTQTSLHYFQVSPAGTYTAFYDYEQGAHIVWNFDTQESRLIGSQLGYYTEFATG